MIGEGRRKMKEGRWNKEEGRFLEMEEGRWKREDFWRWKREDGRGKIFGDGRRKMEEGRWKREELNRSYSD
ncbi:hypothetical protein [Microcoleus sp. B4-D4]|uniref:hypothetical protein n=1 Tax=Microcoleus sp. B4-D4 TaxID=2818667 RepID=UPI002FCF9C0A